MIQMDANGCKESCAPNWWYWCRAVCGCWKLEQSQWAFWSFTKDHQSKVSDAKVQKTWQDQRYENSVCVVACLFLGHQNRSRWQNPQIPGPDVLQQLTASSTRVDLDNGGHPKKIPKWQIKSLKCNIQSYTYRIITYLIYNSIHNSSWGSYDQPRDELGVSAGWSKAGAVLPLVELLREMAAPGIQEARQMSWKSSQSGLLEW